MKRRRFLVLSAGCMMGLLSACGLPMSENVQVEELLRAPRLPGDYGALQNALNEWLGESAQLKYPMQGELLSPFLLQDLDGDGQQDAAVLYTTAQSSNVCIAFLQKDAAGVWQVRQSIEGLADTVDNVRLAQLQDGAATQLVVGYLAAQGDSYLAVYSYENGTVNAILEQSYEQYLVEDITGGGNEDLFAVAPSVFDGGLVAADMQLCALRYRQALAAQEGLPELTPESLTGQPGVGQSAAQVFHSVDERCKSYQH